MSRVLGLLVVLGCGAPRAAPANPVPLTGELTKLSWYVGDWACKGTTFATKEDKETTWDATVSVRGDAGGGVVAIHMLGPADNSTAELKGYDPETRRWYHVWTTRDGQHGSLTATAWEGDTLIATDDADPKRRTVMTRLGPDRYSHGEEVDAGEGFAPTWVKVCSRKG